MGTKKLTARFVETVRTDQEREDIADEVVRGLQLRVTSQGSKTWAVRYTRTSDGRRRRLTLGSYPNLSLEKARLRAREELAAVARGADPASDKQEELKADTFERLSASWLARYARPNKVVKAVYDDELMLKNDILPIIGAAKVETVSKRDMSYRRFLVTA
jgi:Arm domain-containing DNA-binding protein